MCKFPDGFLFFVLMCAIGWGLAAVTDGFSVLLAAFVWFMVGVAPRR